MQKVLPGFELEPISEFDPKVFIPHGVQDKNLCGFMLALACVYNDYKNVLWGLEQLCKCGEEKNGARTAYNGQIRGFNICLRKQAYSIGYELLVLIRENKELIESEVFMELRKKMLNAHGDDWDDIVAIALKNRAESGEFVGFLRAIRNNVGFHYSYDSKGLEKLTEGYRTSFWDKSGRLIQRAAISKSNWMAYSRFYFADAAVEGVLKNCNTERQKITVQKFSGKICRVLYNTVELFISTREGLAGSGGIGQVLNLDV